MCYHLTPIRVAINKRIQITNVGEDVEEREPLYTTDGKVDWYSHFGKQYGSFSKKKKAKNRTTIIIQVFYSWVYIQRKQKH